MEDIILKTPSTESVIHCGAGVFEKYTKELKGRQIAIVTDSNVFAYYRYDLWCIFGDNVPICIITAGERSKNIKNLNYILKFLLESGMKRNCTVIAFGGGVVGDIAGLAASLYMRGVNLVQIPTTLLAQVDSSVGGKTAIDFGGVKNVIGSFYQPQTVIADPLFFKTLPDREIRCGLGEIIKYGALDREIYDMLNARPDLKDAAFLEKIICRCINHKARIVEEDERDLSGKRKSLNLGHTTGHAFELHYGKKSHGEFVLIGMYYELYIAEKRNICAHNYAECLRKLINKVIKNIPAFDDIKKAAVLAVFDKKNDDKNISLIVPESEGVCAEIKLSVYDYEDMLEECAAQIREEK